MMDAERTSETSVGQRLLRSAEVEAEANAVAMAVQQQLAAALQGPIGSALAAGNVDSEAAPHTQALLGAEIPRRFIAVGAALTTAYATLSEGDEVRTAGALICAERLLFPSDPLGIAAVRSAVGHALAAQPAPLTQAGQPTTLDAAAAMQMRVAAGVERLERAYLQATAHVEAAALASASWKQVTGGAGPSSGALYSHFGPFLEGMLRWTFYLEAAIAAVIRDDWADVGAALIAARKVTGAQSY
ncbi:MAG TPA: hypothetical protein VGW38_28875 [Chloroflexota bacterium]|nr:hypothetical protein [Chloroflexota bacterium]